VTQQTSAKVVVMSVLEDANSLVTALGMGASGYILKTMPGFELAEVVDSVMDGGAPISPTIARFLLTQYSQPKSLIDKFRPVKRLSKRERQVLTRVANGMSRKEVARDIGISPNTVAEYLKNIYTKYSVTKMAAAVAIAVKNEDIDL
jgi:DNA-binding NarL/FixJ family response regulator